MNATDLFFLNFLSVSQCVYYEQIYKLFFMGFKRNIINWDILILQCQLFLASDFIYSKNDISKIVFRISLVEEEKYQIPMVLLFSSKI